MTNGNFEQTNPHTDIPDLYQYISEHTWQDVKQSNRLKRKYINVPCAFDIETTSFYVNGEKCSVMYAWVFGFNGITTVGRTWGQFKALLANVAKMLNLHEERILICYVHNLAFEFQAFRHQLEWENVFSLDTRKPVKCLCSLYIEFRCTLILTNISLEKLATKCTRYPCKKMVGDLDYSKLRHTETPLTENELEYIHADAFVVMSYIMQCIEEEGNIARIPLTQTGYVRRAVKNACLYSGNHGKNRGGSYMHYRRLMSALTLTPEEYKLARRAFMGGFTHANAYRVGRVYDNVGSFDLTSSYPAVLASMKFPMTRGEKYTPKSKEDFEGNLLHYCCIFDVEFTGLCAKLHQDHPISESKCFIKEGVISDNGRVSMADRICTTITEQDFFTYRKFYTWKGMRVGTFYRYRKWYLPREIVETMLIWYEKKTKLKGVEGSEDDYMRSKEMINSVYGMMATDIVRDEILYNDEWGKMPANVDEAIEQYNGKKDRFLSYLWGLYTTAYARRNLFTAIEAVGDDYIYSDTDSVKILNPERHKEYFDKYNKWITGLCEEACREQGIDTEMTHPKTITGQEKPLGVWEFEGAYDNFKTLGAKRYLTRTGDKYTLTTAGVAKSAVKYLEKQKDPFGAFCDDLIFPAQYTGKLLHTYIDEPMCGIMTDYMGNAAEYEELSGTHLEPMEYHLSISEQFANYLEGIREI